MKKVVLIVLIFILTSSLSFYLGYKFSKIEIKNPETKITNKIENELKTCIEKNYQTDLTMANCYYEAIEKSEFEIENLLNELKKITTKPQYDETIKSQKQWNEFIKQDNHSLEDMFEVQSYFMPYLISATLKYQNIKERLEELDMIYSYQKDYILPNNP